MPDTMEILVALDFSAHSQAALREAFRLAQALGARVHLLHVFTLQERREREIEGEALHEARAEEQSQLQAAADSYRATGQLGEVLWHDGDPASQIVLTAERQRVDLIVVGASGRGSLARLLLGSVAEGVTRNAPCNVLVVRNAVHPD